MAHSLTAIIKPTHDCNLRCEYCYVGKEAEGGGMSEKTLRNIIEKSARLGRRRIDFIWHGGEPLLMGLEFYKAATKIQRSTSDNVIFENSIQTNATLINDEFLDFCETHKFNISSSIDGPEYIHNLTRIYPNGKGSFKDTLRGVKMIHERNKEIKKKSRKTKSKSFYLGGGIITVLTKKNINRLKEVYDFFKENRMNIKINPLIKSGRATMNYDSLAIGANDYGNALVELFDVWFNEKKFCIDVDPFSMILGNLMEGNSVGCVFRKSCRENFISIGPQGDIYPCGSFDGIKEYWLGNINSDDLGKLLESDKHHLMLMRNADTVRGCSPCKYKNICNAGCMHNAYMVKGNLYERDYYCASYKTLFKHLENALHTELKKVLN